MSQTDLFEIHSHETNLESQEILNSNRNIFSADCKKVYDLLMANNSQYAIKEMDVDRARISDLKRLGFVFSFVLNKNRYKAWYTTEYDKIHNNLLYKQITNRA